VADLLPIEVDRTSLAPPVKEVMFWFHTFALNRAEGIYTPGAARDHRYRVSTLPGDFASARGRRSANTWALSPSTGKHLYRWRRWPARPHVPSSSRPNDQNFRTALLAVRLTCADRMGGRGGLRRENKLLIEASIRSCRAAKGVSWLVELALWAGLQP
jgi:hypothetical protein